MTNDGRPIRIAQLSDTHFLEPSESLEGGFGYDTSEAFEAVRAHYGFSGDGSITSTVELVDDPRWPRRPLGCAVMSLLDGELTWEQFEAIVTRKRAGV